MALLTYELCTSKADIAEAAAYAIPQIRVGLCLFDDPELEVERLGDYLDRPDYFFWITARDQGQLVAVLVAEPGEDPYVLRNVGAAVDPSYSLPELTVNLAIARHTLLPSKPGTKTLSLGFLGSPALDALLSCEFGDAYTTEDAGEPNLPNLVKVTMTRPEGAFPEHFDVPRV